MILKYSDSFGRSSSKILLGTAYFGETISEEDSFRIMDRYVELGGNHIDTARLYANGEAEKVIGRWLKSRNPQNIFLSTKGAFPRWDTPHISRLSEAEIRSDLSESREALGIDCIEFYWLHRDDKKIPVGVIIEIMNALVREGKIKKFGASNWSAARVREANLYAESHGLKGFDATQVRFSPAVIAPGGTADRTLEDLDSEGVEYYGENNMPVAAYASQAKGFFSKLATLGVDGLNQKSRERYLCSENLRRFEIIKRLANEHNCSIAAAVCGALVSVMRPDIFPIIGCSRVEQVDDSMMGGDIIFTENELKELFLK